MSSELKDLIEFVSKSLVDMPDDVEVNEIEGEQTTVIELKQGTAFGEFGRGSNAILRIGRVVPRRTCQAPLAVAFRGGKCRL